MADTADFQTMYAMLKVHSANQAKEIEILKERLSTPPADAALADDALCESLIEASDMRWNGDVYIGDGADLMNLVRAALRARAVPDCAAIAAEYLEAKRVIDAGPQLPDSGFAPRRSWKHGEPEVVRWHKASAALAMLAASKAGDGGAG